MTKSKFIKIFWLPILVIGIVVYVIVEPMIVDKCMDSNYYSNQKGFDELKLFLKKNDAIVFPNGKRIFPAENPPVDSVYKNASDSLKVLIKNIHCIDLVKFSEGDSTCNYLLFYHEEFGFPPFAYLIVVGNTKPLKGTFVPDDFVDYHWLDDNTISATVKWN